MEQQRFFIKCRTFAANDARLQDALAAIYETPERPRCMCIRGGVEMYVAKHRQYVVKRMPGTGSKHHPTCASYEPKYGQSGLGDLMGESVIEHSPESIELRVDFPLTRIPGKAIPRGEPVQPAEINAPRHRMSLRAVMHYLFERARFNRWYPAMEGKRSQGVIHKYLMEAATEIEMKGVRLSERLYVPEQFSEERKAEIAERRRKKLSILLSPEDDVQFKMALILGEFKGSETSTFGRKVWIKHMSDAPLFIDNKAWERIERVYGGSKLPAPRPLRDIARQHCDVGPHVAGEAQQCRRDMGPLGAEVRIRQMQQYAHASPGATGGTTKRKRRGATLNARGGRIQALSPSIATLTFCSRGRASGSTLRQRQRK